MQIIALKFQLHVLQQQQGDLVTLYNIGGGDDVQEQYA